MMFLCIQFYGWELLIAILTSLNMIWWPSIRKTEVPFEARIAQANSLIPTGNYCRTLTGKCRSKNSNRKQKASRVKKKTCLCLCNLVYDFQRREHTGQHNLQINLQGHELSHSLLQHLNYSVVQIQLLQNFRDGRKRDLIYKKGQSRQSNTHVLVGCFIL